MTEKPEVISFAGGMPDPELFPLEEMKRVSVRVLEESGKQALQYATTEGFPPLRAKIAERMNRKFGTAVWAENVLITSGSQQGLDLTGKAFLNEGDAVLCESPSYLGAIQAFKTYQPRFIEVTTDDEGMNMEELRHILQTTERVKLIYAIPDFQNPTGRTWSATRRERLIRLANEFDVVVIEDNPYGELRFEGDMLPSVKSLDTEGRVIYLGTFSKTLCPGYRIGWVAADKAILSKYILLKQAADLQTSTISQREIDLYMATYNLDAGIERIKAVYKQRRDVMISALKREMPGVVRFTEPSGGLFTWVELPVHINARDVLVKCLEQNVAFVPGGSFYPNAGRENTLRLNYSNMDEVRIVEGIRRLADVLKENFLDPSENICNPNNAANR